MFSLQNEQKIYFLHETVEIQGIQGVVQPQVGKEEDS